MTNKKEQTIDHILTQLMLGEWDWLDAWYEPEYDSYKLEVKYDKIRQVLENNLL